jgi:hypothetical protein
MVETGDELLNIPSTFQLEIIINLAPCFEYLKRQAYYAGI